MVTGQLTRSEAESALRRLEGLRDDWQRQRTRWSEHHQKALDIKNLQRSPSAPLTYTVEVCCNQMGIATIRFNELVRLIQDFRACALYLVHLPIPEGPDASFRSALPDLWSIPHAAPGSAAVALPGQVAGFSAQMAPVTAVQGLSTDIMMYNNGYGPDSMMNNQVTGGFNGGGMQGMMSGMMNGQAMTPLQPQQTSMGFAPNQLSAPNQFGMPNAGMHGNSFMGQPQQQLSPYSSQPLPPQHTQALYQQQTGFHQQNAQQARVNHFAANVFQPSQGFNSQAAGAGQNYQNASPLNPFNPNAPHQSVLDASQRYPAVQ
ncbi:hypothetical protein CROQUDRAFT_40155 [Cronartium quercuum f. sp. fusiforme G11]|uniref:Uncharacterized protein n=1 Tax=Cronartium quercuum f. sp. fusiforme G11 TaxID=708437 RepID=A0A9P6NNL7_9BASI|nr:hypothetical protein CROQUDRAFT_40155 [Cronartium quercuum f. sp. fusiforme G11]